MQLQRNTTWLFPAFFPHLRMLWPIITTMGRAWPLGGFGATSAAMDVYFAVSAAIGFYTFQDVLKDSLVLWCNWHCVAASCSEHWLWEFGMCTCAAVFVPPPLPR